MRKKRSLFVVMCSIMLVFFSCSLPSVVTVRVQKSPEIPLPGIKEIAVADFQGAKRSGSQIATLTQSMLMDAQYFEIMERDKLRRVLEEQNLGMSGVVDEATAAQVGKLLGVDALIFGEVTTYRVEPDKEVTKMVKERRGTGKYQEVEEKDKKTGKVKKVKKEIYEEVYVPKKHWVREGTVAINFRVVEVETGRLLAAHSESKSYDSEKGRTVIQILTDTRKSLKPQGEILANLSKDICRKFVRMIAPYTVAEKRVIESGKESIEEGAKYAESGLWPEATEAWKRACVEMPQEPAAFYNLGLAYEVQGMLDDAEMAYQSAVKLKQKKLYMDAIARIRKSREEQEKLRKLLEERE